MRFKSVRLVCLASLAFTLGAPLTAGAADVASGKSALKDWHHDAPGVRRLIRPADLAAPPAPKNKLEIVSRPPGAMLQVPPGFTAQEFAAVPGARMVRVAPNGDIFLSESNTGQIRILRADDGAAQPKDNQIYATGLDKPFGIAFYPAGPNPEWVYVGNNNSVVRFAYKNGDLKARKAPETVIAKIAETASGHITRDIAFSKDGKRMFVSVGSRSDSAEGLRKMAGDDLRKWEAANGLGAAWDGEAGRADVVSYDPKGGNRKIYATGVRNCVGIAVQPVSGDVWCSTNERDAVEGEEIADHASRVKEGAFYGWPWYYVGANEDLRHKGERPDLASKVTVPDILFQPHSAPLVMAFYSAPAGGVAAFPADYNGDAFFALHGTINDGTFTGAKVVRAHLENGVPTGDYEDFLTGFVIDDTSVWGRPVGLSVAHDGALLVTDDGAGKMWRVAYSGKK